MNATAALRRASGILFAPSVWAVHFLTVYASEALACHQAAPWLHDLIVAIATLVAVVAIIRHRVGTARSRRRAEADDTQYFLRRVGAALGGLSLIGIGWVALAVMFVSACR
jgi:hypothetical protein